MKYPPLYQFKDLQLITAALTHRSYDHNHNERLEWLGDAIIQLAVSRLLFRQFPRMSEFGLSQIRALVVNRPALATIARRLQLGDYVRLGKTNIHGGRDNDKLLANLMEAYIAAVYLDGGDTEAILYPLIQDDINALGEKIQQEGVDALVNMKTRLQEFLQKRQLPPPRYEVLQQQGKADHPTFTVRCHTELLSGDGRGSTRVAAEQDAAQRCLSQLQEKHAARG